MTSGTEKRKPTAMAQIIQIPDTWRVINRAIKATQAYLNLDGSRTLSILLCDDKEMKKLNHDFRGKNTPTNVLSFPTENSLPHRGRGGEGAGLHGSKRATAESKKQSKSAPLLTSPLRGEELQHLGDIAISLETITREASEQNKPLAHHLSHMVVHGILHLLGHDHENDTEADMMESIEINILAKLGVDNPYTVP